MESKVQWDRPARKVVELIGDRMNSAHRGVVDLELSRGVVLAFGNDGYADDIRSQRSVEAIRRYITSTGWGEEIAFQVSEDGYTWAMLIAPDGDGHLLAELLTAIAWDGWTFNSKDEELSHFRALQSTIADGVIEDHRSALADCLA